MPQTTIIRVLHDASPLPRAASTSRYQQPANRFSRALVAQATRFRVMIASFPGIGSMPPRPPVAEAPLVAADEKPNAPLIAPPRWERYPEPMLFEGLEG